MNKMRNLRLWYKPKIFINYRRSDSAGHAGRLYDDLAEAFSKKNVFMDIDTIKGGDEYINIIEQEIEKSDAMIVIIGTNWLTVTESGVRRIDDPKDLVRWEIGFALKRKTAVIPVLVQGAAIPREKDLPEELKPLARRHAVEVSDNRWQYDVGQLIQRLQQIAPSTDLMSKPVVPWRKLGLAIIGIVLVLSISIYLYRQGITGNKQKVDVTPANSPPETQASPLTKARPKGERIRPLHPGISVSALNVTTGNKTGVICCIVQDGVGQKYLLSAEHVFRGKIGEPIIQPSLLDGGGPDDKVAMLIRSVGPTVSGEDTILNEGNGAIARPLPGVELALEIPGIGKIQGVAENVLPGDVVRVVGSFTGITESMITAVDVDHLRMGGFYEEGSTDPKEAIFKDMIVLDDIASADDSGSPVLTKDNKLIGIVYGGSKGDTVVMPIKPILERLRVKLVY
jgi:TIR domain-containing protein